MKGFETRPCMAVGSVPAPNVAQTIGDLVGITMSSCVENGSSDSVAATARSAGASVISEPTSGKDRDLRLGLPACLDKPLCVEVVTIGADRESNRLHKSTCRTPCNNMPHRRSCISCKTEMAVGSLGTKFGRPRLVPPFSFALRNPRGAGPANAARTIIAGADDAGFATATTRAGDAARRG